MFRLIIYMIFQTVTLVAGQVLLKLGMNLYPSWEFTRQCIVHQVLPNWYLWVALLLIIGGNILWIWILKVYPFSLAYPLTSLGFIASLLLGMFIFHEPVNWVQWIGVVLIMGGCFCIVK